jgi:uncharacterized protein with LGFP repeats
MIIRKVQRRARLAILTGLAAGTLAFAAPRDASACTVVGLIYDKWVSLGGSAGVMGDCTDNAASDGGGGYIQPFANGYIDWVEGEEPQAFATYNPMAAAWMSRYGGVSTIGQPFDDPFTPTGYTGLISRFKYWATDAFTDLVYNPGGSGESCYVNADHVCEVYGRIWELYGRYDVGLPIDEVHADGTNRVIQHFQNQYIIYNSSNGYSCLYWNDGTLNWSDGAC